MKACIVTRIAKTLRRERTISNALTRLPLRQLPELLSRVFWTLKIKSKQALAL